MGLVLPKLTTDVDCGDIGYPGLIVRFWLNPPLEDYKPPWADLPDAEKAKAQRAEPWRSEWYHGLGRSTLEVEVPGALTDSGEVEILPVGSGRAYYDLERRPDFDPAILIWAAARYAEQRQGRLQAARKNL